MKIRRHRSVEDRGKKRKMKMEDGRWKMEDRSVVWKMKIDDVEDR